jgi:S-adenosylmethionine hydrolase
VIPYQKPVFEKGVVKGNIPVLDVQYGNIWSNIDTKTFKKLNARIGDKLHVSVYNEGKLVFDGDVMLANTFSDVKVGENLGYMNSLLNFSLGINQESFSGKYKVYSGATWTIQVQKKN